MVDVQRGTLDLPILIQPRINQIAVTQKQIKEEFSNVYISDVVTPLTWTLEYTSRSLPTVQTQLFSSLKSTESTIFFEIPDSFYADFMTWMIMIRWDIIKTTAPTAHEKIYSNEAIQIEVKDLQLGL